MEDLLEENVNTQRKQDVDQFSQHHGAVFTFVVQLGQFNEIFQGAGILVFLDLAEDGQEFLDLQLLLA